MVMTRCLDFLPIANALAKRFYSLRVPMGVGVVLLCFAAIMDTAPLTFRVIPTIVVSGQIESSANCSRTPSDGDTNLYLYSYRDLEGIEHKGKSWAPTFDSKHGIFWKPFPLLAAGSPVKVEYIKWNPGHSRISGMRTSNLSLDGLLFLSFLGIVLILANSKMMQGSMLFFKKADPT